MRSAAELARSCAHGSRFRACRATQAAHDRIGEGLVTESIRLPAHLEISSLIRLAEANGGFATVLNKGERDAGTILITTLSRNEPQRLFERMPQLDGTRPFVLTKTQDPEKPNDFHEYVTRRSQQDPDIWILEVDIDSAERFIALLPR